MKNEYRDLKVGNPTASEMVGIILSQSALYLAQTNREPSIVLLTKNETKLIQDSVGDMLLKHREQRRLHMVSTLHNMTIVQCKHPPIQRVYS